MSVTQPNTAPAAPAEHTAPAPLEQEPLECGKARRSWLKQPAQKMQMTALIKFVRNTNEKTTEKLWNEQCDMQSQLQYLVIEQLCRHQSMNAATCNKYILKLFQKFTDEHTQLGEGPPTSLPVYTFALFLRVCTKLQNDASELNDRRSILILMNNWYEKVPKTPHSKRITQQNGVPLTIFGMLAVIADIQLHDDYKNFLTYYEMVFWDKKEMKRYDELEQSTEKDDVDALKSMKTQIKFALNAFKGELLRLLEWKTWVNFEQYIEHVNDLAAQAPELKKMLTDRYLSQEEQNEREATGILHVTEPFQSNFLKSVSISKKVKPPPPEKLFQSLSAVPVQAIEVQSDKPHMKRKHT
jgi:hypothetical protein